jgi:hypothetical protein
MPQRPQHLYEHENQTSGCGAYHKNQPANELMVAEHAALASVAALESSNAEVSNEIILSNEFHLLTFFILYHSVREVDCAGIS